MSLISVNLISKSICIMADLNRICKTCHRKVYSPLTSMCNAKTANVSIIPHVCDFTKIHVISLPHSIVLIVFKQYFQDEDFFGAVIEQRLNCSFWFYMRLFVGAHIWGKNSKTPMIIFILYFNDNVHQCSHIHTLHKGNVSTVTRDSGLTPGWLL